MLLPNRTSQPVLELLTLNSLVILISPLEETLKGAVARLEYVSPA